jgi:hypothetical protein
VGITAANFSEGQRGNACSFDGTSTILVRDLTANPANGLPITNGNARSICMWVKGVGMGQNDRRLFSEGSGTINASLYNLGTANNGNDGTLDIFLRTAENTTRINHTRSVATPLDGTWHHVAVSDKNGALTIYIDGNFDKTITYTNAAFNATKISIGAISRATNVAFYNGQFDDVAVWNHAISSSEVRYHMSQSFGEIGEYPAETHRQGDRVLLLANNFPLGQART